MIKLPPPAEAMDPDAMRLRLAFSNNQEAISEFEEEPGNRFHYEDNLQYGPVAVTGLRHILNRAFPGGAEGFFHSQHGLFLDISAALFLPPSFAAADLDLCIHCRKSGAAWEWRLVRCKPTAQRVNLIRKLLESAASKFALQSPILRFSPFSTANAFDIAEWAGSGAGLFHKADEKPHLDFRLAGAWFELSFQHAPLRLNLSRLVCKPQDKGWRIILREEPSAADDDLGLPFIAELSANLREISSLKSGQENFWRLPVNPSEPSWPAEPGDSAAPAPDAPAETSPVPETRPPQLRAAAEDGLWAQVGEQWLRIPVQRWAANAASAESRAWPISALFPNWNKQFNADLWIDNCQTKELRLEFDRNGAVTRVELAFESLFLVARSPGGFLPASWQPNPVLPPHPDPNRPWTLPRELSLVSEPGGALTLILSPKDARLHFSTSTEPNIEKEPGAHASTTLWSRAAAGWLGPSSWAANDPNSASGISALRGLIPLLRQSWLIYTRAGVQLEAAKAAEFPPFAIGERLTVLRTDAHSLSAELELSSPSQALLRHRHATPHLDVLHARTRPGSESSASAPMPEEFTWVEDRYSNSNDSPIPVRPEDVADRQTIAGRPPSPAPDGPQASPEFAPFKFGELFLFSIVWRTNLSRWDVRLTQRFNELIGDSGLRVLPLRLTLDEKDNPSALEFSLTAAHPCEPVLRGRRLILSQKPSADPPAGVPQLDGAVALPAAWLAQSSAEFPRIVDWRGRAEDPAITFLGIESEQVSLSDTGGPALKLSNLKYWFRLDGLDAPISTNDHLILSNGSWTLGGDKPALDLAGEGGQGAARFERTHDIAPNLQVTEVLLGPDAGTLRARHGDEELFFQIRTSYHALPPDSLPAPAPIALLRAGDYHLAWAGALGKTTRPFPGNLAMGALTRLFLRLSREAQGNLAASGMAGWQCVEACPGFTSNTGRATLYAGSPGQWTLLRLSGKWTAPSNAPGAQRSIIFFRHDFSVQRQTDSPASIEIQNSITPWVVTEQTPPGQAKPCHFFQGCAWIDNKLQFSGRMLALPAGGDFDASPEAPLRLARASIQLNLVDPARVRWMLDPEANPLEAPLHFHPFDPSELVQGFLPGNAAPEEAGHAPGARFNPEFILFGLTRVSGGSWLICPVRDSGEKFFEETSPKLWIFHENGEDLISLEGFAEKLGSRAEIARDGAAAIFLKKCAEETLSFLRWRKPAVLEWWRTDPAQPSVRTPVWTLIDAPLLNTASKLDFLDIPVSNASFALQPARGLITRALPPEPGKHDPFPIRPEPGDLERFLSVQTLVSDRGEPAISAALNSPLPPLPGLAQLRREMPFELAAAPGAWDFDRVSWTHPGAAFLADENKEGALAPPLPASPLPPSAWRFACPRPGERTRLEVELSAGAAPAAPNEFTCSALASATIRAPRARIREHITLALASPKDPVVRWTVHLPASSPRDPSTRIRILAGSPNQRSLRSGQPWLLAVAAKEDTAPAPPAEPPPRMTAALRFTSNSPFALQAGALSHSQPSGPGNQIVWLLVPPPAFGRIHELTVTPSKSPVKVEVGIAKTTERITRLADLAFMSDSLEFEQNPARASIPNQTFKVLSDRETASLLPPMPHLIGLLRQGRVAAYGPCHLRLDVAFTEDKQDCHWIFTGAWTPPAESWNGPPDAIAAIRPDGSINFSDANNPLNSTLIPTNPHA